MFEIAFAIGVFAYSIFFLGLLGILYAPFLAFFSFVYWTAFLFLQRNRIGYFFKKVNPTLYPIVFLAGSIFIFVQAVINAAGLLGPEIGFDAMWYHLTLPKLYLFYHAVLHFPDGILYYSDMPRLTEMLYTAGLSFGSDFFARGIHFLFGILTCVAVYKLGRKFFLPTWAILLPVIFYSNLVVGWESSSGYIDLARTFFTVMSLWAFFTWMENKDQKWLMYTGFLVGLTISTKLLAFPDIGVYAVALFLFEKHSVSAISRLKRIGMFCLFALVPVVPWLVFSYVHTGNPVYPLFSSLLPTRAQYLQVFNPLFLVQSVWNTFARASDPINPLFLALLPFFVVYWKKLWEKIPFLIIFAVGGFVSWYMTPQSGGGRYILPFLPIFSLVSVFLISHLNQKWQRVFFVFIALVAVVSLAYRSAAVAKYLPLLTGKETKAHFMQHHLQFHLGDFYDIDGYFAKHVKPTDKVLLYGFHNLYYVDFPYILSDWAKPNDTFDYVAVQGNGMPSRFAYWNLVYFNTATQVRLYSQQGKTWQY